MVCERVSYLGAGYMAITSSSLSHDSIRNKVSNVSWVCYYGVFIGSFIALLQSWTNIWHQIVLDAFILIYGCEECSSLLIDFPIGRNMEINVMNPVAVPDYGHSNRTIAIMATIYELVLCNGETKIHLAL